MNIRDSLFTKGEQELYDTHIGLDKYSRQSVHRFACVQSTARNEQELYDTYIGLDKYSRYPVQLQNPSWC